MEDKKQSIFGESWIGLILILLAVGTTVFSFKGQTPFQEFVYGVLTGIAIGYLMIFIYTAGKTYFGKSR